MKITDTFVLFYGQSEFYSNWNMTGFTVKGIRFANGEQYMMYCKAKFFGDADTATRILAEPDPRNVKALGRAVRGYDDAKWSATRLKFVSRGLLEKAMQNPRIQEELLGTGDRILVEASPYDTIWGIGLKETDPRALDMSQWRGENLLGQAWMWVREVLRTGPARAV